MRIGKLRHRITFQQRTTTQNSYGELTETWADYATRWASVEPLKGREYFSAKQTQAEVDVRFRCRYLSGLNTADFRIKYGSRIYDIVSIINVDERNKELIIMAKEKV